MADYTQITSFAPKDALTTGDPNKKIRGSQLDPEFTAIAAAIQSKFDSVDIASNAEAAALTSDAKLITPAKLLHALQNGSLSAVTLTGSGLAVLNFYDPASGVDEKRFRLFIASGVWGLQTRTDADGVGTQPITVNRTGTTATSINLNATSVQVRGDPIFAGATAYKTANTSRASTTTLADDPHLTLPVAASSVYVVEIFYKFTISGGTGGLKYGFTVPSGATLDAHHSGIETNGSHYPFVANEGSSGNMNSGASTTVVVKVTGRLTTTNAGTFAYRWAQVSSDANATVVYAGAWLRVHKVA